MKPNNQTTFTSNELKLNNNNNSNLTEMTLTELQEIALRQQQQIEINQQLLLAKEKRLKLLKLEEQKNQQITMLSQPNNTIINNTANINNINNANQLINSANYSKTMENAHKLENLKQNVLGQELKIFKLKELRNQILKHKLSNSNMSSELDLIKSLFTKKERELCDAIKSVSELTKQIEQLRKIKLLSFNNNNNNNNVNNNPGLASISANTNQLNSNNKSSNLSNANLSASELEKLKQELQIRNKLNEQQSKKIMQQHDLFNQKQIELLTLDKRIEELQNRIANKRNMNEQIQNVNNKMDNNYQMSGVMSKKSSSGGGGGGGNFMPQQSQMILKDDEQLCIDQMNNKVGNSNGKNELLNENTYQQNKYNTYQGNSSPGTTSSTQIVVNGSSPSKVIAKFATKQEIANTYMNKFGSEAYQRYQMNSLRLLQQQQHQHFGKQHQIQLGPDGQPIIQNHMKQNSNDETSTDSSNNHPSSTSSLASLSPTPLITTTATTANMVNMTNMDKQQQQHQQIFDRATQDMLAFQLENLNCNDPATLLSTALPSHLKLEFDKIKYLPDMVKTIKKRHSISEIEGSAHMVPPQIFQKMLEKHHRNFLDQHQQQQQKLNQIKEVPSETPQTTTSFVPKSSSSSSSNNNNNKQVNNSQPDVIQTDQYNKSHSYLLPSTSNTTSSSQIQHNSNNHNNNTNESLPKIDPNSLGETLGETSNHNNKQQQQQQKQINETSNKSSLNSFASNDHQIGGDNLNDEVLSVHNEVQIFTIKSTKPIIKQTTNANNSNGTNSNSNSNNNATNGSNANNEIIIQNVKFEMNATTTICTQNKRVNFDPHALLLDAAVEGELELVIKCAKQVNDVSEPNDEGITALHNSVCAGHFDIVKFLVEFGCDINYADNDGWTPLHCAASCNNLPMVKFLIEHGASVFATTLSDNETAIKKCEEDEDGYEACYEYLLNAQKNLGDAAFNNCIVYALYSYDAQNDDELSFKCFDKLLVLNKNEDEEQGDANDGWWTCKLFNENKQGLVPNNYLGLYPRVQSTSSRSHQESTIC